MPSRLAGTNIMYHTQIGMSILSGKRMWIFWPVGAAYLTLTFDRIFRIIKTDVSLVFLLDLRVKIDLSKVRQSTDFILCIKEIIEGRIDNK